jgi:pSer/pThr/pTyr-binding forkhead associated (FHA) protein
VENDSNNPHLLKIKHGALEKVFRFNQDEFTLGRGPTASIRIDSSLISSEHLKVRIEGNRVIIKDLNSKHGTFILGKKIVAGEELTLRNPNQEIHLGNIVTIVIKPRVVTAQAVAVDTTKEIERSSAAIAGIAIVSAAAIAEPVGVPVAAVASGGSASPARSSGLPNIPPLPPDRTSPSLRLVTDVEYETEILKAGAARFAEGLKEESRREATLIITEAKQKKETIDQERERIESSILEVRAEFDALKTSRNRIEQEVVRFQTEIKSLEDSIAILKSRKGEIEDESSTLRTKIAQTREEIATTEISKLEKLAEIEELQATMSEIRLSVEATREAFAQEKELTEHELAKQKAHQEALMTELKSKHLTY